MGRTKIRTGSPGRAPEPDAGRARRSSPQHYRTPWPAAGLAALGVLVLYTITLSPTTWFWDTSEYIATAHILGIPHQPGNPLFVVLARAWDILLSPFGLSPAVRINLFSVLMSTLAHGFWFLLVHRILAYVSDDRTFRMVGAAVAVLLSATAFTVWNQSNVNEKVYTVSLFTIALLSWLALRWRDNLGRGRDGRLLLLMVFILALSVGNHLMAVLAAPALLAFVIAVRPRTLLDWKLYPAALVAAFLGLSIHLFLPLRAARNPVINEADPTCPQIGSALVSVGIAPFTPLLRENARQRLLAGVRCEELTAALQRTQYDKPKVTINPITYPYDALPRDSHLVARQTLNYAEYADWQWARSAAGNASWFGGFRPLLTLLFACLAIAGAHAHWKHDRKSFVLAATLFATLSAGLAFYLNFKYGYTLPESLVRRDLLAYLPDPGEAREVRERDYFFIVSFSLWGLWAGIGLAAIWQRLADRLAAGGSPRPRLATAPVLAVALLPLLLNWTWADRNDDWTARDWAYNLLMSIEPYGVVFTNGDNDTFPLWYLQEVEGIRRDVTVMVMSYLNTPWYVKQIRELTRPCPQGVDPLADPTVIVCQRPYDVGNGPDFYAALDRRPTRSVVPLSDSEIDTVAATGAYALAAPAAFTAGGIDVTLPPNEVIIPADMFMATIVRTALADRPVHFAMTTDAYQKLRLRPFLIRQGLAYKLNDGPVMARPGSGIFQPADPRYAGYTGANLDVPRTEALVSRVFRHRSGFPERWMHWGDSATEMVPYYYYFTHAALGIAYQQMGNAADAVRHNDRAEQFLRLGQVRENAWSR